MREEERKGVIFTYPDAVVAIPTQQHHHPRHFPIFTRNAFPKKMKLLIKIANLFIGFNSSPYTVCALVSASVAAPATIVKHIAAISIWIEYHLSILDLQLGFIASLVWWKILAFERVHFTLDASVCDNELTYSWEYLSSSLRPSKLGSSTLVLSI